MKCGDNMKKVSVLIGADLVPTLTNVNEFISGQIDEIFDNNLINILNNTDVNIFNLETPLIYEKSPIKKCGPSLGISADVINGIRKLKPTYLNIVNNHIMDHGKKGLDSTISVLNKYNIGYSGYGSSIDSINKFWTTTINDMVIGIYSCAEHEFSIATTDATGVLGYDDFDTIEDIRLNSNNCDFLIVLYHGGKEFYQYPSPRLKKRCEKIIDAGGDIVICQHSHCIGCEEEYKGKKIVYGQGNFLFDDGTTDVLWENGFLLQFDIIKHHYADNYNYCVLCKDGNGVSIAKASMKKRIMDEYFKRSEKTSNIEFLSRKYREYAKNNIQVILRKYDWFSSTLFMRGLNKITNGIAYKVYFKKMYLPKKACDLLNGLECESWSELAISMLNDYLER